MKNNIVIQLFLLLFLMAGDSSFAQSHPNLILTKEGVKEIRANLGKVPMFDKVLADVKKEIDAEIALGIQVPIPKDMAGGYTHERHKRNFFVLQKAGNLFQITQEEKYGIYVRDMLLEYAKLFPTIPIHPTNRSYATGKIFWQCLNDANWLLYASQAYDCVYDFCTKEERDQLEKDLFRPLADFLSIDNPKFFNRIHNHSTWGNAAVGMIALVMDDKELLDRALYGLKKDGLSTNEVDNDGGFIKLEGQTKAGFLAQLDYSFAPDGYFTEGPYYLRYAIYPFLLYGKALVNNRPDLDILNYRDGILKKAVYGMLLQTDPQGQFFPINDAQKGMSVKAREIITAVDNIYYHCGNDPQLLSVAELQDKVLLDETGFAVAKALQNQKAKPFQPKSMVFKDGDDGKKGGVAVLRSLSDSGDETSLVFKYSAQGMGHGHFDKLSYSLYDKGGEVIQDYGAVRWVNIDQKGGGRYLPENKTFGKQTIGHNTLVVNQKSHYEASVKKGEAHHPDLFYANTDHPDFQIVSAKDAHAYPDAMMHRTLILLKNKDFKNPLLLDIFRVASQKENQYDLPTWFHGHLLSTSFELSTETTQLTPLGDDYGYQHIWKEAAGKTTEKRTQLTWFEKGKFFTKTSSSMPGDELILGRLGANDPNFNLRRDPVFITRRKEKNTIFASVIESHGTYDPVSEIPLQPYPTIESVAVLEDNEQYTVVNFTRGASIEEGRKKTTWTVILANQNNDKKTNHKITIGDQTFSWTGPYYLIKN